MCLRSWVSGVYACSWLQARYPSQLKKSKKREGVLPTCSSLKYVWVHNDSTTAITTWTACVTSIPRPNGNTNASTLQCPSQGLQAACYFSLQPEIVHLGIGIRKGVLHERMIAHARASASNLNPAADHLWNGLAEEPKSRTACFHTRLDHL